MKQAYERWKLPLVFLVVSLLVVNTAFFSASCGGLNEFSQDDVRIGATPIELNTLVYVAEERGYFNNNNIEIEYEDYDTGVAAVNGLMNNEVDIALTMEYVMVDKVCNQQDIVALATIDRAMIFYVLARKDRGIDSILDLKAKTIGVPHNTIMEFFLGRTLELNGLSMNDIVLKDIKAPNTGDELSSGAVDAVVAFEPNVTNIYRQMPDRLTVLPVQSGQYSYWTIVSTREWATRNAGIVKRLVQSVVQAERYVTLHSDETKTGIRNRLKYDDTYIESVWPRNQFIVSLDRSLIAAMEDETRWMIKNGITKMGDVPDFTDYIYTDSLKTIKPEAVDISR